MSGKAALEQAQDFAYDLIFLDIMMPGTDGYETCRFLIKKSADERDSGDFHNGQKRHPKMFHGI